MEQSRKKRGMKFINGFFGIIRWAMILYFFYKSHSDDTYVKTELNLKIIKYFIDAYYYGPGIILIHFILVKYTRFAHWQRETYLGCLFVNILGILVGFFMFMSLYAILLHMRLFVFI